MDEYVEREALLNNRPEGRNVLQIGKEEYNKGWNDCRNAFFECICEERSADVAPVRHGRWVIKNRHTASSNPYMDDDYFASATCSECNFCVESKIASFSFPKLNTTRYCPNCGAKMDLEE